MATAVDTQSTRVGMNRLAKYGLLTVLVAVAATALVRVITLAFVDVPTDFVPFPLGWGPVIASSVIGVLGATVVYGVITRVSQRPNRTFTLLAAVVLLLSFAPLLTMPPAFAATITPVIPALVVMHVSVAAVCIGVLTQMQ